MIFGGSNFITIIIKNIGDIKVKCTEKNKNRKILYLKSMV
jgi:hypothetical protein